MLQLPGVSGHMLQDMLVKLHTAPEPQLQGPRAAAEALLGPQGTATQQPPQPQRSLPALGPLGELLVGRWREEDAHERALMARAAKFVPLS